uniref:NAD-dependent protein deacetylase sir-2.1 n=1 Tax=Meloidogyne enterolobii TaxID=390850 RepID=A0A6V7ULU1_MELEN|nr:unnamed protein product [Meloidogyne enterolobii]
MDDDISSVICNEIVEKIEDEQQQNLISTNECQPSTSSTTSNFQNSNTINLDHPSIQWKKPTKSMFLVQQLIRKGISPRGVLSILYPMYSIPTNIPDIWILQLLQELCEIRSREKLPQWNTFEDAVELIRRSKSIMIISGAGISVSCGIPDFRSEKGIYARLKDDFPELPDPHSMFDIDFFRRNPRPFYAFAKEIFPGQFRPSISHKFIKFLEEEGKLLRNYTQNIDTLERLAGINNLIECHGSFARSTCLNCKNEIDSEEIRENVFQKKVAYCQKCKIGVIKPNIIFFGEDLTDQFHNQMAIDSTNVDLLIIIGSSLQVRPVSLIPYNIDNSIPQILINRELLPNYTADVKLLGDCDKILCLLAMSLKGQICEKMIQELTSRPHNWNNLLLEHLQTSLLKENQILTNDLNIEQFKKLFNEQPNIKKIKWIMKKLRKKFGLEIIYLLKNIYPNLILYFWFHQI